MTEYNAYQFDSKYDTETSLERYQRLNQQFTIEQNLFLVTLRNQLSYQPAEDIEKAIALFTKQTNDLQLAIANCWKRSQQKNESFSYFEDKAESYLLESLARSCLAFKEPENQDNMEQLIALTEKIPGNISSCWYVLKTALLLIATELATISILLMFPPTIVPFLGAFLTILSGTALLTHQMTGAEFAFKSQPVKSGLNLITTNLSLFAPSKSLHQLADDEVKAEPSNTPISFV